MKIGLYPMVADILHIGHIIAIEEAKNTAIGIVALFEEDYLNYYDIQFLMVNELYNNTKDQSKAPDDPNPFPILGYKKAERENISWSHNAK